MIDTLLNGGIGFLSAIVSPVIQGWQNRKNTQIQIESTAKEKEAELNAIRLKSEIYAQMAKSKQEDTQSIRELYKNILDVSQTKAAYQQDTTNAQVSTAMTCLQSSVRPVLTYGFSVVFLFILVLYFITVLNKGVTPESINQITENEFVRSAQFVFSNIITFWFGNRGTKMANRAS